MERVHQALELESFESLKGGGGAGEGGGGEGEGWLDEKCLLPRTANLGQSWNFTRDGQAEATHHGRAGGRRERTLQEWGGFFRGF